MLDTLTGGNFLGTPALEDYNLLERLVGIPPTKFSKTEDNLEDVIKRLDSLEKSLPNFLNNTSQVNESVKGIIKRITTLEASDVLDNQNYRIGKLEEAMEALGSTFSSFKFKREKAFVGKVQKFMYVPEAPIPKPLNAFKIDKTFSTTKSDVHVESSSGVSSTPIVTNLVLDDAIDLNARPPGNT